MLFDREVTEGRTAEKVLGVGHKVFDKALRVALELPVSLTFSKYINCPLVIFQVFDRITDQSGHMRQAIVGIECNSDDGAVGWSVLRDWEVLERLNGIRNKEKDPGELSVQKEVLAQLIQKASERVTVEMGGLNFPFRVPEHKAIALIWGAGETIH